jgi:hypothetical protein
MKVLLITAFFYPQNVIAVSRVGQWAKYLSRFGHDVTILTTKKYPFWPLDYHVQMPDNLKIIEVDYLSVLLLRMLGISDNNNAEKVARENKINKLNNLLRFIKYKMLNFLDLHDFWIIPAKKIGLEKAANENFDLIISSYSPGAVHHIAKGIKLKIPKAIWIADFRDLWSKNHLNDKGIFQIIINKIRERECIKYADILTTVSGPLASILKYDYPFKNVHVIPNGYDPEDYSGFGELNNYPVSRAFPVIISYTGMIYENKRDPTPLLIAINNLIDAGLIEKNQIMVNFYGPSKLILEKIINLGDYNRHGCIGIYDQVERYKSILIQKKSDILLLLEWSDKSSRGVLTGKLFEYLVSGRPILGVGVHPDSEAGTLIKKTDAGFVSETISDIENFLIDYIKNKSFKLFNPNIEEIKKYSRRNQVKSMLEIVDKFVNEKK